MNYQPKFYVLVDGYEYHIVELINTMTLNKIGATFTSKTKANEYARYLNTPKEDYDA